MLFKRKKEQLAVPDRVGLDAVLAFAVSQSVSGRPRWAWWRDPWCGCAEAGWYRLCRSGPPVACYTGAQYVDMVFLFRYMGCVRGFPWFRVVSVYVGDVARLHHIMSRKRADVLLQYHLGSRPSMPVLELGEEPQELVEVDGEVLANYPYPCPAEHAAYARYSKQYIYALFFVKDHRLFEKLRPKV